MTVSRMDARGERRLASFLICVTLQHQMGALAEGNACVEYETRAQLCAVSELRNVLPVYDVHCAGLSSVHVQMCVPNR